MDDFHRHLNESLQDPDFAEEWELLASEREYIKATVRAHAEPLRAVDGEPALPVTGNLRQR